jgi:hypothetical protein
MCKIGIKIITIHIVINNNVYGGNKNMKTNIILIALFVAAFMFPNIGSFDTANAETDISHCANLGATAARSACEAAAHVKSAPQEKSYRNELSEKNRMQNGIPASGLGYSSDASEIQMGMESNVSKREGTYNRLEMRENNRMRNGIPASGQKMK